MPNIKMPERLEPIEVDIGVGTMKSQWEDGFNASHDLWLAYHKQEILRARIDELKHIDKLNWKYGISYRAKDYTFVKDRIADLIAQLKKEQESGNGK